MRPKAPNTLELHLYHQGELEGTQRDAVKAAIDEDSGVRRRYQALLAAAGEFEVQPVPPAIAALDRPAPPGWRRWLPVWAPIAGLAAAAVAVLLVVGLPGPSVDPVDGTYIGTRGTTPELEVWLGTDAGPRPLREGEAVREGDSVQLAYDPHGAAYITLAGRDGTGELEVYRTVATEGSNGLVHAPFSLVLDDAPGPQVFFVLAHEEPLDEGAVRSALQSDASDLMTVTLEKR